jgi:hypothetical protein
MLIRLWIAMKLFACYLLPFLPCCPKIGNIEEGDCIWIQAFGRNSWPDEELGKIICDILKKSSSLSEAFTFIRYLGFDPGSVNKALSKHAVSLAKRYEVPISGQWENIYCIWESDLEWFLDNQNEIDCLWPPELGYYATWHVKLESRERMRARHRKRPIEVCHPAMAARAIAIIWKLRVNVITEAVYPWNFWKNPLWVWDINSVQAWTTAFIRLADPREWWLSRESYGRYFHHLIQKRWVSFWPPVSYL